MTISGILAGHRVTPVIESLTRLTLAPEAHRKQSSPVQRSSWAGSEGAALPSGIIREKTSRDPELSTYPIQMHVFSGKLSVVRHAKLMVMCLDVQGVELPKVDEAEGLEDFVGAEDAETEDVPDGEDVATCEE